MTIRANKNDSVKGESGSDISEVDLLAKNSSLSLSGQAVGALGGIIFIAMVSHSLSQDQAGGLFEAVALFTTASLIATCGADIGLMRFMPIRRRLGNRQARRLMRVAVIPTLIVGSLVGALLFVMARPLAALLVTQVSQRPAAVSQFQILAPLIPVAGVTLVVLAGVRAWSVTPSVVVWYILIPVLRIVLYAAVIAIGATVLLATLAWAIPLAVGLVATGFIFQRYLRVRRVPRINLSRDSGVEEIRSIQHPGQEFWLFSAPRLLENALLVILWGCDIVIVGLLTSEFLTAAYAVASRYIALATMPILAMVIAIPTRISELFSSGKADEAHHLYRMSTLWVILVSWPIGLSLVVYAPFLMSIFGPGYRIGASALAIMTVGVLANSAAGPCSMILLMSGSARANLLITTVAVVINIALMVLLVPVFHLIGAGIASSASIAVMNGLGLMWLWRQRQMSPFGGLYWYLLGSCAICFLGLGEVVERIGGQSLGSFAYFAVLSTLIYALLLVRRKEDLALRSFLEMLPFNKATST